MGMNKKPRPWWHKPMLLASLYWSLASGAFFLLPDDGYWRKSWHVAVAVLVAGAFQLSVSYTMLQIHSPSSWDGEGP